MVHTREHQLVETFVALTDTLVADYDVVELLQTLVDRTADLFDVTAAGIILANQQGQLEVIASSSERGSLVGLLQVTAGEGPCVEAYESGQLVTAADTEEMHRRWPVFAATSTEHGYQSIHSIPLRLRDTTLGSMNLFRDAPGRLNEDDAVAAQALTDVATISILQQQTVQHATLAQEQLQRALDSRVLVEQAKGFIAQVHGIDMDAAFTLLRAYARSHQMQLSRVAHAVVHREIVL
jgi:GAF domain-containing protein